jgi:hypothetical protein
MHRDYPTNDTDRPLAQAPSDSNGLPYREYRVLTTRRHHARRPESGLSRASAGITSGGVYARRREMRVWRTRGIV